MKRDFSPKKKINRNTKADVSPLGSSTERDALVVVVGQGWLNTNINHEMSWDRIPLDQIFNHERSSNTGISAKSLEARAARQSRFRTNGKSPMGTSRL